MKLCLLYSLIVTFHCITHFTKFQSYLIYLFYPNSPQKFYSRKNPLKRSNRSEKKKEIQFFFIFLIFIAWKQIIMHMLPSFCTQHFFSYACNLQLPPPLDLNLPMLRPPPPKTPETGCCSSVWAVLEPLPVPEDFSAVEWTTSFPSCSSAVPVEIPWGPLWCWICSVVLVVPEPALVVPREAWWEISSPLWCFQRADSPSKQQITYNLFIACSSVFRELERGWFRALEGSDSVFSIDLCAWCSPMSSSHARLHFFLTSSFHRFFFFMKVCSFMKTNNPTYKLFIIISYF